MSRMICPWCANDGKEVEPIRESTIKLVDKRLKPVYMVANSNPFNLTNYPEIVRITRDNRSFFLRKDSEFLPLLESGHLLTNTQMGQMAGFLTPMNYSCHGCARVPLRLRVKWLYKDKLAFDELVDVSKLDFTFAVKKQFSFGKDYTVSVRFVPHGEDDNETPFFRTASGKKILFTDEVEDFPHGFDPARPFVFSVNLNCSPWASAIHLYQRMTMF